MDLGILSLIFLIIAIALGFFRKRECNCAPGQPEEWKDVCYEVDLKPNITK
jgi:preprotein translocase subunit SecG